MRDVQVCASPSDDTRSNFSRVEVSNMISNIHAAHRGHANHFLNKFYCAIKSQYNAISESYLPINYRAIIFH